MRKALESAIENKTVNWARARGVLVRKMNGLGMRSWPDRLFLLPGGKAFFIEFKRKDAKPTPLQAAMLADLNRRGFDAECHDNSETAIASLRAKLEAARLPKASDEVLTRACVRGIVPRPGTR